jgi:hypothetical protein
MLSFAFLGFQFSSSSLGAIGFEFISRFTISISAYVVQVFGMYFVLPSRSIDA